LEISTASLFDIGVFLVVLSITVIIITAIDHGEVKD